MALTWDSRRMRTITTSCAYYDAGYSETVVATG